jgi:hypothetical protein
VNDITNKKPVKTQLKFVEFVSYLYYEKQCKRAAKKRRAVFNAAPVKKNTNEPLHLFLICFLLL